MAASPLPHKAAELLRQGLVEHALLLLETHLARRPEDSDALHLAGIAHFNGGRADLASDWFRRALVLAPSTAAHWTGLGESLRAARQGAVAARALGVAHVLEPAEAAIASALSVTLLDLGRADEAEAALRRLIDAQPTDILCRRLLAVLLSSRQRRGEALEIVAGALAIAPRAADLHCARASILLRDDRAEMAERSARVALALAPASAEALNLLGLAVRNRGRPGEAATLFGHLIALDPGSAPAHNNLGNTLRDAARPDLAEAAYRGAIARDPTYLDPINNLALALQDLGRGDEALPLLRRAVALAPSSLDVAINIAATLADLGRAADAEAAYERARVLAPANVALTNNIALFLAGRGQRDEARALFARALAERPDHDVLHANYAMLLMGMQLCEEAEREFREAVRLNPDNKEAWGNLGYMLSTLDRQADAEFAFRVALEIDPHYRQGLYGLGMVSREMLNHEDSLDHTRRAILLNPEDPTPWNNLGIALIDTGEVERALRCYRIALSLRTGQVAAFRANYLMALNYPAEVSKEELAAEHRSWGAQCRAEPPAPHANPRDPERVLRIGYVSPDFRHHSVAYFVLPVVGAHDRRAVHVTCYSVSPKRDDFTRRIREAADAWRDAGGWDDRQFDEAVRQDGIDILIDLTGHTGGNRLSLFARRPAPVQVTWLGYPTTTGLDAIDWRITDIHADPPGEGDSLHSERLMRLPRNFLCYSPVDGFEPVAPPSFDETGGITFGSFNTLAKITPRMIALWAEILHAVPGSGMLLKAKGFSSPLVAARMRAAFAAHGIPAGRLCLDGYSPTPRLHLARYGAVDIALDTFPYNGTTTTCEALWMGVPVVTLRGDRHAARVGTSILTNVGLPELIARDERDYVRRAVDLAGDRDLLRALRLSLRGRVAETLCDAPAFISEFETALRRMWQKWCAIP
ncbi:MAG: tetratricopeptide repeat protein [Alphaproteobacteria bacterium]|nr:tetratricopeptide repeat protein [Alphaproteobacteria bacterium]